MKQAGLHYLTSQFRILTGWYLAALEDISDDDGDATIEDRTNSLAWIAGHLILTRYRNIGRLGGKIAPYIHADKFMRPDVPPPNALPFDPAIAYPSLTESRVQWSAYAEIFFHRLENVDDTILQTALPFTLPSGGKTVEDALVFTVMHETYHIGQMSIIRKALGYPGMQLVPKPVDK